MPTTAFFAVLIALSISAIAAEYAYGRRHGEDWHSEGDTLGNLNLAAGNLVMGTVTAGLIVAGYSGLHALAPVDLGAAMPRPVYLVVGFLLAELLQYWNHRLSHRYNVLVWGHITHHSSSRVNLTTAVRINWFYRAYAWMLYAPMPLLGYSVEEFVAFQAIMNVYNMFMHTRLDVPFGPLGWVLVTPRSHRIHHSADPSLFGNYGASLIVWDRLFGTYRELPEGRASEAPYGLALNVDHGDPIRLNFHYLQELWEGARASERSFLGLLLSSEAPPSQVGGAAGRSEGADRSVGSELSGGRGGTSRLRWLAAAGVVAAAVAVNQLHGAMSPALHAVTFTLALGAVIGFGLWLGPGEGALGEADADGRGSARGTRSAGAEARGGAEALATTGEGR